MRNCSGSNGQLLAHSIALAKRSIKHRFTVFLLSIVSDKQQGRRTDENRSMFRRILVSESVDRGELSSMGRVRIVGRWLRSYRLPA
jgi:hypothetical protein